MDSGRQPVFPPEDDRLLQSDQAAAHVVRRLCEHGTPTEDHRPPGGRECSLRVVHNIPLQGEGAACRLGGRRVQLIQADAALDEKWNSLLECTLDLVVVVDGDGLILHINHLPAGLTKSWEAVMGRSICDLLAPECRTTLRESIDRVFVTGERICRQVCLVGVGSPSSRQEVRIGPITHCGRVIAVGLFFSDITEREKMAGRLRDCEMLLQSMVKAFPKIVGIMDGVVRHGPNAADARVREKGLELYRDQMIQIGRLISVGQASSDLAHRLPQLLTAIGMSVENALASLEAMVCPGNVTRELKAALRAVSAVAAGVEQVRGFAETATKRNLVQRVDLRAVFVKVLQLQETQARLANATISLEGLDRLPHVRLAKGDAEQLLFSLIENVIRSAEGKGYRRIVIKGVVVNQHVEIQFSGRHCSGEQEEVGGSPNRLGAVGPVGQADSFDFCVAKDIVARAGGRIWSECASGGDSLFCVSLPTGDHVGVPME